jgi:uncharacterized membrane protein
MKQKMLLPLTIFSFVHILIFIVIFNCGIYNENYSAAGLFFDYFSRISHGQMLYRDFLMEYPPLATVFFILPGLVSSQLNIYAHIFTIQILLFDLLGLFIISAMSLRINISSWISLSIYTISALAIGPIIIHRYDLIPTVMVMLALYAFSLGKHKTSWFFLALGTMTKIYPIIIAPIFLLDYLQKRQFRNIIYGISSFLITITAIITPFIIISPNGLWNSLSYHLQRGLQVESIFGSFLLLAHSLGAMHLNLNFDFGAWNIVSSMANNLATVSTILVLLGLGIVYWSFYRNKSLDSIGQISNIVNYSFLTILLFISMGKVFSPQFIIWLYPLVPLINSRWRNTAWIIFMIIAILTYYIFPLHYEALVFNLKHSVINVLFLRNVLLLTLAGLLLINTNKALN